MTNEKQGVSAWLRGIVDECEVDRMRSCTAIAEAFGIDCKHERTCRDCITRMMTDIADRIDLEMMENERLKKENDDLKAELADWKGNAEGFQPDAYMKLPLDADGAAIHVGDAVYFESEVAKVYGMRWNGASWSLSLHNHAEDTASHRCRLVPTAALIGADGVPIGVGDIVYRDDDPEPLQVDLIYAGSTGYCTVRLKDSAGIYTSADAPRLSHKKPEPPDSWEKLEKDARKTACDYAPAPRNEDGLTTCDGCPFQKSESCSNEMTIDMVERAKKLAGIEEEVRND